MHNSASAPSGPINFKLKSITEAELEEESSGLDCSLKISKWINAEEAARYLKLSSIGVLRNLVYEKRIPYYKLGRLLRFKISDLDQVIEASRIERRFK